MPDEPRLWGLRPLERQLAIVVGIAMGLAWAIVTGAESTVAGRIVYFAMGTPIGVIAGLRVGQVYLDEGPGTRRFFHVMAYIVAVLGVSAAVDAGRATVPGLLGAVCFVPTPLLLARNAFSARGDRRLAGRLFPVSLVAAIVLAGLRSDRGWIQFGVVVIEAAVSVGVIVSDRASERARVASGALVARPQPAPARGWRLWSRLVGAPMLLLLAVDAMTTTVESGGVACGTLEDALAAGRESGCPQEATMRVAGGLVLVLIAGVLVAGAIRGRGRGPVAERETPAPGPSDGPPARPPRTHPLRARRTDPPPGFSP